MYKIKFKREAGVKGKPSAQTVISNITAIYDGPTQVLSLKVEGQNILATSSQTFIFEI
jgi:hypothetical protein